MKNQRIESLDLLRGLAIILIIFFHSSIYNFANIHLLDFSNPPIIVVLMSFMGLWGGVFIIYSMVMNTLMLGEATRQRNSFKQFYYLVVAGTIYIGAHYLLNLFLGRWNVDFVNNKPMLTMTADFLRHWSLSAPKIIKLFDGSSLGTIGLNLIIISLLLFLYFKKGSLNKAGTFYIISGISGGAIMLLSFLRVYLYPFFSLQIESGNYLSALILSFLLANPYPLLPYLAYGIFGMMIGLMIYQDRNLLLKRVMIPTGLFFIIYGLIGIINFDKTISKPDFFWYFKTNFELGLFLLIVVFFRFIPAPGSRILSKLPFIRWFSRVSLSIYLLETTVSEIFRIISSSIFPGWNETINGCLIFGSVNIVIWAILLFFWQKSNFRYSFEYLWVLWFNKIGKKSTKLDFI